ncbi:D-alanyl-D-alanine carboxypeptidase family protein [Candidatus Tisiphia endosymbiont of Metellina segmentata]|uniref:D-alanyl-D-alanine carboxypeptidase family protein n=1 Tax=Candidatus Tisiphia endosymbiont of Metellina segmentata TaxID=3066274 RepID=UPI00313C984D|nr:D-alanyl-D-alanine carboxypeptidase [Rickettsiaceae bacterium]MDD9337496.1 D-alanyl-D-alanine carboxypeptidase [Rickettsiaceae bacterium]
MLIRLLLFFTCVITFSTNLNPVYAAKKLVSSPTQTSLVVDYNTGRILHDKNSTTRIYPASLTKLMTLYLLFEALESGRLSMNQRLYVSKNAEKMLPCKLGLKEKETITVKEAIFGLIIRSANDVAMVVAENIKGTEENFARLMNIRAKQLGMKDTYFKNASGWHHPYQKTTARDLAKLAIGIKRDFPKYYAFFSRNNFVFRGNIVRGHNKVNETYEGVEGLKTGYTTPAGYNLITAATRQNKSLVAIVTGGKSAESRNMQMVKLLDTHFDQPRNNRTMVDKLIIKTTVPSRTYSKKTKSTKVATNLKVKNRKKL